MQSDDEGGKLDGPVEIDENSYLRATVTYSDVFGSGKNAQARSEHEVHEMHPSNHAPEFPSTETGTRSIDENSPPGTNIGAPVAASDDKRADVLTYDLGGADADSFNLERTTGQLLTNAPLNHEARTISDDEDATVTFDSSSYTVDEGEDVNVMVRLDGARSHRLVVPVTVSNDTAESGDYSVVGLTNGRLTFSAWAESATFTVGAEEDTDNDDETVDLDFGTLPSGVVEGTTPSATVTIEETNVPPTFNEGPRTTRSVAENTPSGADVGSRVTASDDDSDTLTYSLSGTDAGSFRIGRISGQIRTFDSLNFETKNSYSVTVTADDDNGGTDSIDVTINVNDVNEAPVASPIGDRTLAHNVVSLEIDLSTYFSDPDTNDTLSYSASSSNTGVATVGVNGTALTLTAVSAGSATITVTAADRQAGDSDRLTVSQDFMVTVQPGIPGKPVILTPTNMIGGRGIELNWLPVDGADDYEVEIFSTTGMSAHDPDVEGLIAEVTGLTPGAMYSFRVRACNPSCVSSTSPLYSLWSDPRVHSAPTPTADGHQADHTAAYRIVSITSSPGLPNGVPDAAAVIRAAIRPAVAAWNSEMATEIPDKDLKICEIGDTTCRNRNHDGGIVTIETQPANTEGDGNFLTEPCGAAVACIGPIGRPLGGINDHIVDMEMIIEEPAWECRGRDTFNRTCEAYYRVFWTNVVYDGPSPQVVDPTTGNSVGFYRNAVRVITHEFGHALGLTDFYADDPEDLGSLEDAVMHTGSEIHLEDLLQLKAIYILHDPAGHGY